SYFKVFDVASTAVAGFARQGRGQLRPQVRRVASVSPPWLNDAPQRQTLPSVGLTVHRVSHYPQLAGDQRGPNARARIHGRLVGQRRRNRADAGSAVALDGS